MADSRSLCHLLRVQCLSGFLVFFYFHQISLLLKLIALLFKNHFFHVYSALYDRTFILLSNLTFTCFHSLSLSQPKKMLTKIMMTAVINLHCTRASHLSCYFSLCSPSCPLFIWKHLLLTLYSVLCWSSLNISFCSLFPHPFYSYFLFKNELYFSVDPAGHHHLHPWEVLWGLNPCSLLDEYDLHGNNNYHNDDADNEQIKNTFTLVREHSKFIIS